LAAYKQWGAVWDALPAAARRLGMFFFAVVGWVFFRSTSFTMALGVLARMFTPVRGVLVLQPLLSLSILAIAAWAAMVGPNAFELKHSYAWPRRLVLASALAASLAVIIGLRSSPFLYYQF
jgi:hypothetical protein